MQIDDPVAIDKLYTTVLEFLTIASRQGIGFIRIVQRERRNGVDKYFISLLLNSLQKC